jgi:integrase
VHYYALNYALHWRLGEHNVCKEVTPPRVPSLKKWPLSLEEAKRFLAATEGDRFATFVLGLTSGMRLGELGGLFWSDMDLARRVLHVKRSLTTGHGRQTLEAPKTPRSRRIIGSTDRAMIGYDHSYDVQGFYLRLALDPKYVEGSSKALWSAWEELPRGRSPL